MKILTYVFVSMMACFAGVIYGARFATVQPAIGTGSEMNIIAAVIVGEVLLSKVFKNFALKLLSVVIGAIIYYLAMTVVLKLGLNTDDLKLFTARRALSFPSAGSTRPP